MTSTPPGLRFTYSLYAFERSAADEPVYYLLVVAGLDTVAASLSLHFRHLAENADDQARLRADPSLIPGAVEEFLRRYGIVTTVAFSYGPHRCLARTSRAAS